MRRNKIFIIISKFQDVPPPPCRDSISFLMQKFLSEHCSVKRARINLA